MRRRDVGNFFLFGPINTVLTPFGRRNTSPCCSILAEVFVMRITCFDMYFCFLFGVCSGGSHFWFIFPLLFSFPFWPGKGSAWLDADIWAFFRSSASLLYHAKTSSLSISTSSDLLSRARISIFVLIGCSFSSEQNFTRRTPPSSSSLHNGFIVRWKGFPLFSSICSVDATAFARSIVLISSFRISISLYHQSYFRRS